MSKTSKAIIAIALTIVLFVLLFVMLMLGGNSIKIPATALGNTAGNLYNNGLYAEADGKVFFANPFDDGKLYSMNLDQTNLTKLSNQQASYINAAGKYIFFAGRNTDTSTGFGSILKKPNMCMVTADGKKNRILSQQPSQSMLLVGDTLYYQHYTQSDGADFSKMSVNKRKQIKQLDYLINPACYYNGSIYFNGMYEDHKLYAFNTATGNVSMVWNSDIWNPIFDGSYVYYMDIQNNYRLCRYSFSSNTIEVLANERIDTYNYYNGIIYYQINSLNSPRLMRMNADGTNKELVCEGVFSSINTTSTYTYFTSYPDGIPTYCTPTFSPVNISEFRPVPYLQ